MISIAYFRDMGVDFRMDREAFKANSFKAADDHRSYWKDKSCKERLAAAFFLIKHAYQLPDDPRLDREAFEKRKR